MDQILVTHKEPNGFALQVHVAACVLEHKGKFLLLKRAPGKPQPETWCLPGGKQEKGEELEEALEREVREEAGITISAASATKIASLYIQYQGIDFIFHMFFHLLEEKPPVLLSLEEHTEWAWVSPEEAFALPLIPGGPEVLSAYFHWRGL